LSSITQNYIQLRRATASQWTASNPVLLNGEPAVETDTGKFKVGDGETSWVGLPYFADEEQFLDLIRDLGPAGGPFVFIGSDIVMLDTLLSGILSSLAALHSGSGAGSIDTSVLISYVWDGAQYKLANNAAQIPTKAARVFDGPVDPVAEGFIMRDGDEWRRVILNG
jgi:hypothetical protein